MGSAACLFLSFFFQREQTGKGESLGANVFSSDLFNFLLLPGTAASAKSFEFDLITC